MWKLGHSIVLVTRVKTLPVFTFPMDLKLTESWDKAISLFLKSVERKPDQLYRTKQGLNHTTRIAYERQEEKKHQCLSKLSEKILTNSESSLI